MTKQLNPSSNMVILKKMIAVNSTEIGRHHALNLGLKRRLPNE